MAVSVNSFMVSGSIRDRMKRSEFIIIMLLGEVGVVILWVM